LGHVIALSPTVKKVTSFDDLMIIGIEVAMFENDSGGFAVVMRRDKQIKGLLCITRSQADDLFKVCVDKAVERYICN